MIQALLMIVNLFLIEVMLSIDNVTVLALIVKDLKPSDQPKALKYGILGAFILKGASLFVISFLVRFWALKILGGIWLLWLVEKYFFPRDSAEELTRKPRNLINAIVMVELMDLVFSIDNIFATTALTSNIIIIYIGVFLGIIAMRFVAGYFVQLINKFPSLETSAYVVIFLLGLNMITQGSITGFNPSYHLAEIYNILFSIILLLIFFLPIIFRRK